MLKKLLQMHLKLLKTVEATGGLAGNKSADKITKVSRNSPEISSEAVENETENIGFDRGIKHILPEQRQRIVDTLGLI